MYNIIYRYFYPRCIPARVLVCIMMFTACWTSYMMRLQMPILIVPMIKMQPGEVSQGACKPQEAKKRSVTTLDPFTSLDFHVHEETLKEYETKLNSVNNNASDWDSVEGKREERDGNVHPRVSRDAEEAETRPPGIHLFNGLPFDWSPTLRGQLIAAYSYGNVPGNFFGGIAAQKWGPKSAILWSSLLAGLISLITPLIAQIHWSLLLVSRIIVGVTGGIMFPACHSLVAKWAPPDEKSRFIWSLLGGTFGTIFTYPMIAAMSSNLTWEAAWYIPAFLMFVWIVFWVLLTYDSPDEHPAISDEERDYILNAQAGTVQKRRPSLKQTPVKAILTSIPFLSLVACHFGNIFLIFFYQNVMMLYLTKALGFQLTKGGFAAGLPWGGRMFFGFIFSWAGDTIKKKQILSVTVLRKVATIFSHFIPGIFLVLVGYSGCNLIMANVFLFLALGFNGAASVSNLSNNQDLSPNYAGFVYGIMNTIGSTAGMIVSPMVEEIAGKHGHTIEKWQILFWISALVCVTSMVVFIIGGSGKTQPWNEFTGDSAQGSSK